MALDVDKPGGTLSGLSDSEAREFHGVFVTSFIVFVVVAIVAHFLAWQWRPWLPGAAGYSWLMDGVTVAANNPLSLLA
jgi:light-harvesting complex 1 beta chain